MPIQTPSKTGDGSSTSSDWPKMVLTKENLESHNAAFGSQPCKKPMQRWMAEENDRIAVLGMVKEGNGQSNEHNAITRTANTTRGEEQVAKKPAN